ncbi:MAG: hypothetical protein K9N23_15895 [Akkermansiaceae bacterium]|nr:hypothetical protein [Akkermansiaceae bacterium]MCF7733173.1 hypothetical protein [Akkermansiaceae bacterium]
MLKLLLTATTLATAQAWQPAPDSMLTEWGAKLTPESAWREYPRPAFIRENWTNLNGLWQYAVTPQAADTPPAAWTGEILVPFAIESALSGVKKRVTADDALWYRRTFETPTASGNQRTLLNFEAVDYQSTVWINDTKVGSHTGGFLPFSFDITAALKPGVNTLTVKVTDATNQDGTYQLHGKQVNNPGGIWYTPVTGIWQTVWLEQVPATHLTAAKITPSISGQVAIELTTTAATEATVVASLAGKEVAKTSGPAKRLTLTIPAPQLWSPSSPTLYDLTITAGKDTVKSYVGLRETSVVKAADNPPSPALRTAL